MEEEVKKEQIIEQPEIEKSENNYSKKLEEIDNAQKEQIALKSKASEMESLFKSTFNIDSNIRKYLDRTSHPKKSEYVSMIEDIKKGDYNVKDENSHMNFLATKLFLSKEDVPFSLKNDYDVVESSNYLSPTVNESLDKLKHFTEVTMDRMNKEADRAALSKTYGNIKDNINIDDPGAILNAFDQGKISREELKNKSKEFLNRNENLLKQHGLTLKPNF